MRGHSAVCVLNSDSPTLPTACLVQAARQLAGGHGLHVVLGPAEDGGYYLLGMTALHERLYAGIDWSTERVAAQTRAAAAGLPCLELPAWYDVDDRAALGSAGHGPGPRHRLCRPVHRFLCRAVAASGAPEGVSEQGRFRALLAGGAALLLLVAAEWACHLPGSVAAIGSDARLQAFVALECVAGLIYFGTVWLVRSGPVPRRATAVVLVLAAAMRVLPLATPPFLSSDLFRYVWDGRVQAHGINPYLYLPAAPELRFLRDDEIYASTNRSEEAPTIYPPVAQLIFAAIGQVWSSLAMVKLVMAGFEAVAIGVVAWLLHRAGRPGAGVLVYAWNPLPIWEYAGNGHIDGASLGFMALAMLVATTSRRGLTGAVLALAILCKLLPAAVFPAFWRRWDWGMLAATMLTVAALYGVYAVGAGWHVLGYLPGYASEEGMETGQGFFALRALALLVTVPSWAGRAYLAVCGAGLLGLAASLMLGERLPADPGARTMAIGRAAAVLATAATVVISPHYPWYLGWLSLFACFAPYHSVIYLSASGVLLYLDPYHREPIYPWVVYGPCLGLAVWDYARASRSKEHDPCLPRC